MRGTTKLFGRYKHVLAEHTLIQCKHVYHQSMQVTLIRMETPWKNIWALDPPP